MNVNMAVLVRALKRHFEDWGRFTAVYVVDEVPMNGYPALRILPVDDDTERIANGLNGYDATITLQVEELYEGRKYDEAFEALCTHAAWVKENLMTTTNWNFGGLVEDMQFGRTKYRYGVRDITKTATRLLLAQFDITLKATGQIEGGMEREWQR